MLTPRQRSSRHLTPALGVSRGSPYRAEEGAEALRGEVTDPRSPAWTRPSPQGPTHALGSKARARSAPGGQRQGGPRAKQSPPPTPARRARSGRALPTPPAAKPAPRRLLPGSGPAAHRTSGGSDRPSSPECRCPPRPRCGGSGWSPWCAAGRVGEGRGRQQRRPHTDMAQTRPHGRLPTASEASASEPPPPARPGARRHGGPPPPVSEARRETESPRR